MEVILLQGAEADIQEAFEFYGGPEAERADRFLQRLDRTSGLLRENPAMGPIYDRPFRRLILQGFHHAMFYTVGGQRIFVSAVLDLRLNPTRIRRRLGLV
jgi:plasmid stabilization system protein ParE